MACIQGCYLCITSSPGPHSIVYEELEAEPVDHHKGDRDKQKLRQQETVVAQSGR